MGDTSFEKALAQYRDAMLQRARSVVGNKADAEDVVQEALERAWRSRERFVAGAQPAPWLLKITQNVALDFIRKRKAIDTSVWDEALALTASDRDVEQREDARAIAAAIRGLAPTHRTAFLLHDVHGYSSREISMRVHLPYHTVRTHLFRARRSLRSALSGVQS
jgi:RNA polymerase sigma-70 factor (ECF subfamily)